MSKLTKPGFNVLIEKGAGLPSHFSDADYEAAGAKVVEAEEEGVEEVEEGMKHSRRRGGLLPNLLREASLELQGG